MSPKSRQDRALSIKKIFKRSDTSAKTTVVSQKGIKAGGDVVGVRTDADRRLEDQNEAVHAENKRLIEDVKKLRDRLGKEYDRGYLDALKRAFSLVEGAEGRPGKRQLAEMIQSEIAKVEGREEV